MPRGSSVSASHISAFHTIVSVVLPSVVATLLIPLSMLLFRSDTRVSYSVFATFTFLITLIVFRELRAPTSFGLRFPHFLNRSLGAWSIIVSILAVLSFALNYGDGFSRLAVLTWAVLTPFAIGACEYWAYVTLTRRLARLRRVVIAGVSDLSQRLARAIAENKNLGLELAGWFEDRNPERIGPIGVGELLGGLLSLPDYVRANRIDVIYIALPIRHEERTKLLLDELHDTTASIYFVPDIFVFDLIQSRVDIIDGMPVVALCETPFVGMNGLIKRTFDLVCASLILLVLSPVLIAVAIGVAVTTPGSVIFRQRRYGLDGREIIVYKFRSMLTSDDDKSVVHQATVDDPRITRFGAFIRKHSLDELPQLLNVIQGTMSLVGPRPHAVAHNEEYRRLIKGYMIRHKVPPGITGLAQVRGHRGGTADIADMKARVESDLEYLRRWSLMLDLRILWLTAWRVISDSTAF